MSGVFELVLPAPGRAIPVGDRPLSLGRGPSNDVVLMDDTVSWHHAQVWVEGGAAWVRDLGSRNGTWHNGNRLHGSARMADGDRLRIGATYEVELRGSQGLSESLVPARYVEDLTSGIRLLVRRDRFSIGAGEGCDLRVEAGVARAATLLFHSNGEIWVGTADGEAPVEPGVEFTVQGHRLRVVEEAAEPCPTVDYVGETYPYAVRATVDAGGAPQATIQDLQRDVACLITGNRGTLLYVLARKLMHDRAEGRLTAEAGWCTTQEATTGVWGRDPKAASRLPVLLHRLRGQLEEQGFDPWFIEKRRGAVRLRCATVEVQ